MTNILKDKKVQCPYCGEVINVLIDCSIEFQDYIEDCQVCCHPIYFNVTVNHDDSINISVSQD